jgi:single-stranded DNA-binding protein
MNRVTIEGRLERIEPLGSSGRVALICVLIEGRRGETEVVPAKVFGEPFVASLLRWDALRRGASVRVEGMLRVDTYHPSDGSPSRSRLELHARTVTVLSYPPSHDAASGPREALAAVERASGPLDEDPLV